MIFGYAKCICNRFLFSLFSVTSPAFQMRFVKSLNRHFIRSLSESKVNDRSNFKRLRSPWWRADTREQKSTACSIFSASKIRRPLTPSFDQRKDHPSHFWFSYIAQLPPARHLKIMPDSARDSTHFIHSKCAGFAFFVRPCCGALPRSSDDEHWIFP